MYAKYIKPVFDFFVALTAFLLLSPIFLAVYILLKWSLRGPVFFVHERPGYKERPIRVIKFKTMNDKRDESGNLLPNMQRITPMGAFLRRTSLDEIPQLINVIKGDISLVGPRPLEMRYLPYYSAEERRRHTVRPGITGWAQVNGRNAISWEEKFRFDLWYVDNISFGLDVKILFLTLVKVFKKEGVNADSSNTVVPLDQYLKEKQITRQSSL